MKLIIRWRADNLCMASGTRLQPNTPPNMRWQMPNEEGIKGWIENKAVGCGLNAYSKADFVSWLSASQSVARLAREITTNSAEEAEGSGCGNVVSVSFFLGLPFRFLSTRCSSLRAKSTRGVPTAFFCRFDPIMLLPRADTEGFRDKGRLIA